MQVSIGELHSSSDTTGNAPRARELLGVKIGPL